MHGTHLACKSPEIWRELKNRRQKSKTTTKKPTINKEKKKGGGGREEATFPKTRCHPLRGFWAPGASTEAAPTPAGWVPARPGVTARCCQRPSRRAALPGRPTGRRPAPTPAGRRRSPWPQPPPRSRRGRGLCPPPPRRSSVPVPWNTQTSRSPPPPPRLHFKRGPSVTYCSPAPSSLPRPARRATPSPLPSARPGGGGRQRPGHGRPTHNKRQIPSPCRLISARKSPRPLRGGGGGVGGR